MFDVDTIIKAIQLVGPLTDAGKSLYDGFHAITHGATQDELKTRYAAVRQHSDDVHAAIQHDLSA